MRKLALLTAVLFFMTSPAVLWAFEPDTSNEMQLDAARAILDVKKNDPGIQEFFDGAAGYAVFPSVGKGAIGVGGAHGKGLVIVDDKVIGKTSLSQITIGLWFFRTHF
jgi:hypothetical protein